MKDTKTGQFTHKRTPNHLLYKNKEWLHNEYSNKTRSVHDIAMDCGVVDSTIHKSLVKFQIPRRPVNYRWTLPSNKMPYMDEAWLREAYSRMPATKIAKMFNRNHNAIMRWLRKFNIPIRNNNECRSGKFNGRFVGFFIGGNGYKYLYKRDIAKMYGRKVSKGNYIQEHVYVMTKHLGRMLSKSEVIHHKDGDRLNNAVDNLQLFDSQSTHIKYEQLLNTFAKKLLFSNLINDPKLKKILLDIFDKFSKNNN